MSRQLRALSGAIAVAAAALAIPCGAGAQSSLAAGVGNASATAGRSFIDIAVGKPRYATSCGDVAGFTCSNNGTSYSITAGNMFTQNVGASLAYLDLGNADRAGGSVRARGLNLSAVGRVPLGDSFAVEGKIGTTYGVTHVQANPLSGVTNGRDSGFGLAYGVALDVNFARGLRGSVGLDQHAMHFAGQGTSTVRNVTVGLGYQF